MADAGEHGELVRTVIEECRSDEAGLDRMAGLLTPGYVHHTPWGDWDVGQFREGLRHVDSIFADRRYTVLHLVADATMVAAFMTWTATRRADGSAVEGRGAYHCRVQDGLIAEDGDVYLPAG